MAKIGVLLPTRESVMYPPGDGDPRPLVEMAVAAEQAGFDSVWAGDSVLAKPRAEPLTLLAGVATATERVELGTAVLIAPQRNPEQLAQASATLDALSGGRFILGLGAGPPNVGSDFELVGADFATRGSRSFEVAERMKALWSGTGAPQMYPLPGRAGGPPIWVGGEGPRTLERTARHADGWFPISPDIATFTERLDTVRDHLDAAGRPVDSLTVAVYVTVTIAEPGGTAAAQAELAEHSERYYGAPHDVISRVQGSCAGESGEIADFLRSWIDAGAEHLCIRFGSPHPRTQLARLTDLLDDLRS